MNKTRIEWADMTWNPVTGCLHNCEYCYARKIANRFKGGGYGKKIGMFFAEYREDAFNPPYILDEPHYAKTKDNWYRIAPYPFGFEPTFHRYRLDEPQRIKKPQNIFVCSMADLFGDWVPDEWIEEVFEACEKAPQHNYLFLTKNPGRFQDIFLMNKLKITKNMWFGFSTESQLALNKIAMEARYLPQNSFISIEPIHGTVNLTKIYPNNKDVLLNFLNGHQYWLMGGDESGKRLKWVIVGAESGNRKGKIIPEKSWIDNIVEECKYAGIPVFMKDSLIPIVGEENMLREFPEGLRR